MGSQAKNGPGRSDWARRKRHGANKPGLPPLAIAANASARGFPGISHPYMIE